MIQDLENSKQQNVFNTPELGVRVFLEAYFESGYKST